MNMTEKQINKRSETLAKTATTLGSDIQTHLVNIATFIFANSGNVAPAETFVNAMAGAGSVRLNAIQAWLRDFAAVKFNKDAPATLNKKLHKAITADDETFKARMADAAATDWRTHTKAETINLDFDFDKAIESILKRYDSKVAEHGDKLKVKNIDKLEALKALVA